MHLAQLSEELDCAWFILCRELHEMDTEVKWEHRLNNESVVLSVALSVISTRAGHKEVQAQVPSALSSSHSSLTPH